METILPNQALCPSCSAPVDNTAYFCPICGKNIKEKPPSTGLLSQIGLYLVSVLLPPLFIGLTIKYLKSSDSKAKRMGIISLGFTIIVLAVSIWISISFINNLSRQSNQILNQYQNVGF